MKKNFDVKFFYNACRHHVYEPVVRAVWKSVLGKETTAPENAMLNECNGKWDEIDQKKIYKTLKISDSWLENKAKDVVEEISQLLARKSRNKDSKLRGDYKQCAELALTVIGHTPVL